MAYLVCALHSYKTFQLAQNRRHSQLHTSELHLGRPSAHRRRTQSPAGARSAARPSSSRGRARDRASTRPGVGRRRRRLGTSPGTRRPSFAARRRLSPAQPAGRVLTSVGQWCNVLAGTGSVLSCAISPRHRRLLPEHVGYFTRICLAVAGAVDVPSCSEKKS